MVLIISDIGFKENKMWWVGVKFGWFIGREWMLN